MNFKALLLSMAACFMACAQAESRAELVQKAQEIKAQMCTGTQKTLLKWGAFGFLTTAAMIQFIAERYCSYKAFNELLSCYLVDCSSLYTGKEQIKTLYTAYSDEVDNNGRIFAYGLAGALTSLGIGVWFLHKNDKQEELQTKLEAIEKQVAYLDAAEAKIVAQI